MPYTTTTDALRAPKDIYAFDVDSVAAWNSRLIPEANLKCRGCQRPLGSNRTIILTHSDHRNYCYTVVCNQNCASQATGHITGLGEAKCPVCCKTVLKDLEYHQIVDGVGTDRGCPMSLIVVHCEGCIEDAKAWADACREALAARAAQVPHHVRPTGGAAAVWDDTAPPATKTGPSRKSRARRSRRPAPDYTVCSACNSSFDPFSQGSWSERALCPPCAAKTRRAA